MNALIEQCRRLGIRLRVEGGALAYDGPKGAMTSELAAALKAHKTELLAALARHADPLCWRVSLTEPGGRTVEVDTPSGYTLRDWQAYADRYHGPGCAVTAVAGLPEPRAPVNLDEALRAACEGVAGITPAQFPVALEVVLP